VITPCRKLILCADNRKEMEDWIAALKTVQSREHFEPTQYSMDHFSGMHNWYACSHARPTYCNVCREALSGVTSHGLSCEVCKFKAHKRCAVRATSNCKWTTLASIGKDIIEDEDGGNLPVSAKCTVCDKTCGSVLRLQDWRCLWCKAMVHTACKESLLTKCPLGLCKVSVIPPTALNSIDSDGFWKATCPPSCTSPLLVFVNSKSGDNQGVKFLRRFKQLLNPAQVFDLMNGGPHLGCRDVQMCKAPCIWQSKRPDSRTPNDTGFGKMRLVARIGGILKETGGSLRLFQKFDTFRILVCGGDGSVGWVLSEIDSLNLHKQCQLGVLPLGTGNDLARVLGWGSACDDDTQLPQILEKLERASTKMLDRNNLGVLLERAALSAELTWSVMAYETKLPRPASSSTVTEDLSEGSEVQQILFYEDSVAAHLSKILTSDQHSVDFVARVGKAYEKTTESSEESEVMAKKLDLLLLTPSALLPSLLARASGCPCAGAGEKVGRVGASGLSLQLRRPVDEQNAQTQEQEGFILGLSESEEKKDLKSDDRAVQIPSGNRDSLPALNTKILFPSECSPGKNCLEAGMQSCSQWPETPLCRERYTEKCVMNNYFGIGLDAKISLDFNSKRDEHPEKCRSRTKNMMWYGVLGTRELLHRTYKNLEQKVLLECDGRPIPLPSLQGIAVLNIPSYAGGTNFWGGTKEDDMAVSRVIKLQHHRIAQCRTVKISILGDEGVPVQRSGNDRPSRVITVESWSCRPSGPNLGLRSSEVTHRLPLFGLMRAVSPSSIREIAQSHRDVEQELAHAVNASSKSMDRVYGRPRTTEGLSCSFVLEMVNNVRALRSETELLLAGKLALQQLDPPQKERLTAALVEMGQQLRKLADTPWLCQPVEPGEEEERRVFLAPCLCGRGVAEVLVNRGLTLTNVMLDLSKRSRSGKFRLVTKFKKEKNNKNREARSSLGAPVHLWGTEEVAAWLEHLSLCEYKDIFTRHDIRGSELLHLERRDLKVLPQRLLGRRTCAPRGSPVPSL
ncbi:hypothetical protein E2I00_006750, partial [Balaenoptera physalus]